MCTDTDCGNCGTASNAPLPTAGTAPADAVTIFTNILETSLQSYGEHSVRSLSTAGNLGIMLMHAEMHDEAAALFEWTTSSMKKCWATIIHTRYGRL